MPREEWKLYVAATAAGGRPPRCVPAEPGDRAECGPRMTRAHATMTEFPHQLPLQPATPAIDEATGLYDPAAGKDSCGVGFIVNLDNSKSHQIVEDGLTLVKNLTHRGAVGADPLVGDGAGILVQLPHLFFAAEAKRLGFALPKPGHYAAAHIFTPQDPALRAAMEKIVEDVIRDEGQELLGWRDVPVDNASLSQDPDIRRKEPVHRQVFIGRSADIPDEEAFERKLYIVRKVISARIFAGYGGIKNDFYV